MSDEDAVAKDTKLVDINREMRDSYLRYSMSVIVGRALPDVRDGLKPVHRRILFAMKELGNTHDKPFKKSARVVGDVIGKYHPHGEMAVYDAIVRMAQDFSLRAPLIEGQGNFGSIDGDSAAAPRYTEIRMQAITQELLKDIDKDTVSFGPNYDDTQMIPLVLPARFPNLLVNGSSGIAVGMSSHIPPHNLKEVISACLLLLEDPEVTVEDLFEKIPGPDFPTAGIVEGRSAILKAYKTGRGIVSVSSECEIEDVQGRSQIVVTEIPYQVNKARLIEGIAELVKEKRVEGISDIRDESSREGLRIVIQVRKGLNAQVILNQLQKLTSLKTSFGMIFLALDKNNQPRIFNLKEMLEAFLSHRKDVIVRRLRFDLKKAQERLHILQGLEKALEEIERVIQIIRSANEVSQARSALIGEMEFSHRQAQAILDMKLQKLTGLERGKLQKEMAETRTLAKTLAETLSSQKKIEEIIRQDLEDIQNSYGEGRKTKIIEGSGEITDRDLIKSEEVVVFLTRKGLVKRIPLAEYRLQKRGGKGLKGWELRNEGDYVWKIFQANTLDRFLVFTNAGRLHFLDVFRISSGTRQTKERSLKNLLSLKEGEEVRTALPLKDISKKEGFICMLTKKGILKKTALELFSRPRQGGINALSIGEGDALEDVQLSLGKEELMIATKKGQVIRFKESDVRPMGRSAKGVRGIRLKPEDCVVSMEVVPSTSEEALLVVTEKGFGKRARLDSFKVQRRGGSGVLGQKITEKTGDVVFAGSVDPGKQVMVTTNQGQSIRFFVKDVSIFGRVSQGVRFINLKGGEKVTGVTLIDEDGAEESL